MTPIILLQEVTKWHYQIFLDGQRKQKLRKVQHVEQRVEQERSRQHAEQPAEHLTSKQSGQGRRWIG